ncbi:hypothetical protein ACTQV0_04460 [Selenomonas montiformis]
MSTANPEEGTVFAALLRKMGHLGMKKRHGRKRWLAVMPFRVLHLP